MVLPLGTVDKFLWIIHSLFSIIIIYYWTGLRFALKFIRSCTVYRITYTCNTNGICAIYNDNAPWWVLCTNFLILHVFFGKLLISVAPISTHSCDIPDWKDTQHRAIMLFNRKLPTHCQKNSHRTFIFHPKLKYQQIVLVQYSEDMGSSNQKPQAMANMKES